MPRHLPLVGLLLLLGLAGWLAAASRHGTPEEPVDGYIYARVTRVYDGDTFAAITATGVRLRVRLAEIDTPEKGEPWSNRARQRLTGLVDQRDVSIRLFDIDTYKRIVGRVFIDDIDVNALLVEEGLAAVYRRYAKDQSLYALEESARRNELGFWSSSYRPRGAGSRTNQAPVAAGPPAGCGTKRFCREMESCAEAMYYLKNCALDTIDGDGDGVPCESLCRPATSPPP